MQTKSGHNGRQWDAPELGGWELAGCQVAGAPEIPAGDGAPGCPAGGALVHHVGFGEEGGGDLLGGLEAEEGEGKAFADGVVVDRENVGAAEAEDEQHLDGPLPYPSHLREVLDDGVVGHPADAGEGRDGAVEGLGGEVAEGKGLVVRETGGAKLLVGAVEQVLGVEVDAGSTDRMKAFEQAAVDGGGRLAVELLVDDAFDQCLEGGLGAGDTEGERPGAGDEFAEFRVGGGESLQGERGVVAWRPGRGEGARHVAYGSRSGGRPRGARKSVVSPLEYRTWFWSGFPFEAFASEWSSCAGIGIEAWSRYEILWTRRNGFPITGYGEMKSTVTLTSLLGKFLRLLYSGSLSTMVSRTEWRVFPARVPETNSTALEPLSQLMIMSEAREQGRTHGASI